MDLVLFGLNHTTAPLDVREHLAFQPDAAARFVSELKAEGVVEETVLLSTCNRTEIYGVAEAPEEALTYLRLRLASARDISADTLEDHGYGLVNGLATEHLFRVSTGIDSLVVGEVEILRQIKDAYRIATSIDATGPYINRLFQQCFRVGKRARTETAISVGGISVGSISVELAERIRGDLSQCSALLIGAGTTSQLVARHLRKAHIGRITVANRTRERAEELVREVGGDVIDFDQIGREVSNHHLIITAVGASERTVTLEMLENVDDIPLLIDLGVPRDIDPRIDDLADVTLYCVDDLQAIVEQRLKQREREVPRVERIVAEEAARFVGWSDSLRAASTIKDLRAKFEQYKTDTLDKWRYRLSDHESEIAERVAGELMGKIMSSPLFCLKGCELNPGPKQCATCEMFDIEEGCVHGHYAQELKCMVTRQLFGLDSDD